MKALNSSGITNEGVVFHIPKTKDILDTYSETFPAKYHSYSIFEVITIAMSLIQIGFLGCTFIFSKSAIPLGIKLFFMSNFVFWRVFYNLGLGTLLYHQSQNRFVSTVIAKILLNKKVTEKSYFRKLIYRGLRYELSKSVESNFCFDEYPDDFISWLIFRKLVDFILINGFVSYIVMALAFLNIEVSIVYLLQVFVGCLLIGFNYWVKVEAQKLIHDYAWYWGDFFFLKVPKENLVVDGVFEMAPHPMYSLGYIGFYGVSCICNSAPIFFLSLTAHIAQFLFLYLVEQPHITKIYGSTFECTLHKETQYGFFETLSSDPPDLILLFSVLSTLFSAFLSQSYYTLIHAVLWRLFHSIILGLVLQWIQVTTIERDRIRTFYKWKYLFRFSLTMTNSSLFAASVSYFNYPDCLDRYFMVRQTIGVVLILFNLVVSISIFNQLGSYGWYYGDFFYAKNSKLTYNGVYRYFKNPEKTIGQAGLWGVALMCNNYKIYLLALFSHICCYWFISFVESPHMKRLYGSNLRKRCGVERAFLSFWSKAKSQ